MRYADVVFLETEDVDSAHEEALAIGGGAPGVLNPGMIASATHAPRSGYYGSLAELAAVYVHGVAKNHGYQDANKRTAALVLLKFLGANGYPVDLGPPWEQTIEGVADGSISRDQLVEHVTVLIGGDPIALED
ncbi:MAG TPA: Fic family protein [Polyangiaceae bacterium]|nr:Fic family protein [Polyangiaceae bacterium]